jgi:hypothetical protein
MSQLNDELAARAKLTDLTDSQPPAPPDRYGAVRRRAVAHRRRQLATIAAVVAVLAVAAVTIPLGLLRTAFAPPQSPTAYHLSVQAPPRGSRPGLVATGTIDGKRWRLTLAHESGNLTSPRGIGLCETVKPGPGMSCAEGPVQAASATGDPASFSLGQQWGPGYLSLGTVRSDVTALVVTYTNGQVLTLHPVSVFGPRSAEYVVLPTPHPGSVVSVAAFAGARDLGYAIPFDAQTFPNIVRWLGPGQPALPHPATSVIGSGSVNGSSWTERVSIGPWGTCLFGSGSGTTCIPAAGSVLTRGQVISAEGGISIQPGRIQVYPGEAAPSVGYLIVTLRDHSTVRVPAVPLRGRRFFACADAPGNRIVSWAAYSAAGQRLAAGRSLI